MTCPKGRSAVRVKNGIVRDKQRYKCKDCGCNYTQSTLSRKPIDTRIHCIGLYLEDVGFRGISGLTGTTHTTVMRWVKKLGDDIEKFREETGEIEPVSVMELDEMWHVVQKNKQMLGLVSLRPRWTACLRCSAWTQRRSNSPRPIGAT